MLSPRRPPHQRAEAREQLGERERLHEVVVRAAVEAEDPIVDGITRGQNQHRCVHAALPQRAEDLDAISARQLQVQDDRIETFAVDEKNPSSPVPATATS